MKNTMKKSLSVALSSTFIAAMAASPVANADTHPFGMQNLNSGYMQLAEGKCGEGKMKKEKTKEAKCGESHKKEMEGKCGGEKKKMEMEMKMKKDGKCGEGKCGGKK